MKIKYIVFFLLLLSGCIEEYIPKGIEEVSDLLVVEGSITDNESVFRLSRSVGLSESLRDSETVDNAELYIETEEGDRMVGLFSGNGHYVVPTGNLYAEKKYRLRISIAGEEYESTYLAPLFTPEIDSVFPMKRGPGESVHMCVSTHDSKNQSRYYVWSYKEVWEVKAELFANVGIVNDNLVFFDLNSSNNTYYCWGRDSSKVLILASSEKLSENVISQKRLVEIPCDDDKLSILYYINVEQKQVRKEAYDYYSNIQKNIEQTGSIFAPVPSEMKGNIRSITNPDLPVIGYIDVSTVVRRELYVPQEQGLYEAPRGYCYSQVTDDSDFAYPNYAYYQYNPGEPTKWAPFNCVDCRMKYRASKNKPDFWPTNHL